MFLIILHLLKKYLKKFNKLTLKIYIIYKFINNILKEKNINNKIGDWGLGIGDWGLGPIPNPQSPIPHPPSPIPLLFFYI